ncbi:MAG: HNH endonuclease, partial [Deltaproteobacteria bacterium]|nr:HNH endonuclease [Deltaproteobacteria bacterium]
HKDAENKRCESTRWLDSHHITPVRKGGADTLENLTTLCRAHHQMGHLND